VQAIVSIVISLLVAAVISVRAADAKANWDANCAQCHGADGSANTPMGKKIQAKNLTDPKVQGEFTDAKAMQLIKEGAKDEKGKTTMKAFGGKLTDDEIKALVAYVRTLKK
jgi:mono/diheme cytochrome c family protein